MTHSAGTAHTDGFTRNRPVPTELCIAAALLTVGASTIGLTLGFLASDNSATAGI